MGLIFAEFAAFLKSPKIDTVKNKPYNTSSLRVLEIATMGLFENLTLLPKFIFSKITKHEKFPIYGNLLMKLEIPYQHQCNHLRSILLICLNVQDSHILIATFLLLMMINHHDYILFFFQLTLTVDNKTLTFVTLEPETEEINLIITHIGRSIKNVFPAFPLE